MVRRSDVWVFNIRQHHIDYNFSGPNDPSIHGEANVDQPWFGKSGEAEPRMQRDDLVIVRRTSRGGNLPAGVVGLWRFDSADLIDSPDQIPWNDKDYRWALYCRPIQRCIEPAYTENWDRLAFSYRQLQSEVISLSPADAFTYFRELLTHEALTDEARQVIARRYQFENDINTRTQGEEPSSGSSEPRRKTTEVDRRLRDEQLVRDLKNTHNNRCQVCGDRRNQSGDEAYSEVHHIKPLGHPHSGPDEKANMLVLCPNHHADFDNGIVVVDPESGSLVHPFDEVRNRVQSDHAVSAKYYRYHLEKLAIGEAIALLK